MLGAYERQRKRAEMMLALRCWLLATLATAVLSAQAQTPCDPFAKAPRNDATATASFAAKAAGGCDAFNACGATALEARRRETCLATDVTSFGGAKADVVLSLLRHTSPTASAAKAVEVLEASAAAARDAECVAAALASFARPWFASVSRSFSAACHDDACTPTHGTAALLEAVCDSRSLPGWSGTRWALLWRGETETCWFLANVLTAACFLISGACGVDGRLVGRNCSQSSRRSTPAVCVT